MLRLVTSQKATMAQKRALERIYGGKVEETSTWVETPALLVTEVIGKPYGRYFVVVLTSDFSEDDRDELDRLEAELGSSLANCVLEQERYDKAHSFFPGSSYFYLITLYGS